MDALSASEPVPESTGSYLTIRALFYQFAFLRAIHTFSESHPEKQIAFQPLAFERVVHTSGKPVKYIRILTESLAVT